MQFSLINNNDDISLKIYKYWFNLVPTYSIGFRARAISRKTPIYFMYIICILYVYYVYILCILYHFAVSFGTAPIQTERLAVKKQPIIGLHQNWSQLNAMSGRLISLQERASSPLLSSALLLAQTSLCLHRVIYWFDVIDIRSVIIIVIVIRCHC